MKNPPAELTLLEQHIYQQNQRIIEMSKNLEAFCTKGQDAIDNAEKKTGERKAFVQWVIIGVVACAGVFGSAGYFIKSGLDAVALSNANDQVKEATDRATAAQKSEAVATESAAAVAVSHINTSINELKKNSGWSATDQGRLAKKFFDTGYGEAAAKCLGETWTIKTDLKDVKWCIPTRRGFWDFGEDSEQKFGWKIP